MASIVKISDIVFAWSFSTALIFAAVDWIRPLSVSPFFNVNWLIALSVVAFLVRAVGAHSQKPQEESVHPPLILFFGVFIFSAAAARSLGLLAAAALATLATLVVWVILREERLEGRI